MAYRKKLCLDDKATRMRLVISVRAEIESRFRVERNGGLVDWRKYRMKRILLSPLTSNWLFETEEEAIAQAEIFVQNYKAQGYRECPENSDGEFTTQW